MIRGMLDNTLVEFEIGTKSVVSLDDARAIGHALKKTCSVEKFYMWLFHGASSDVVEVILEGFQVNQSVKELTIKLACLAEPKAAGALCAAMTLNKTITRLDADCLGDEGSVALAKGLTLNHGLKILWLQSNNLGDVGAVAIANALKVNHHVIELDLFCNNIGTEGIASMAEMLKTNRSITKLNLRQNDVGAEGSRALMEALKVNTTLTDLDVGHCGVELKWIFLGAQMLRSIDVSENGYCGMEDAHVISNMLKSNKTLERLLMNGCEMEPQEKCMEIICEGLKWNQSVHFLDVDECDIGSEGLRALAQVLKVNHVLQKVFLYCKKNSVKEFVEPLEGNGSITYIDIEELGKYSERNRQLHARVRDVAICVLCIGRYKRANIGAPKEVFWLIAKQMWKGRADLTILNEK